MKRIVTRSSQLVIDVAVLALALWLAFLLRFDWDIPTDMLRRLVVTLPYIVTLQYVSLMALDVPRSSWRYIGLREVKRIGYAIAATATLLLISRFTVEAFFNLTSRARYALIPIGIIAIDSLLALVGLAGVRALRRTLGERADAARRGNLREVQRVPTLLIGAGEGGLLVARDVAARPDLGIEAVGFVDDDPEKLGTKIHGIPVLGTTAQIPEMCERYGAQDALITIASASGPDIRRINDICKEAGIRVKIIPPLSEIVGGKVSVGNIREVAIEDLLGRAPVELDLRAISEFIRDKVVLVTGAGGSIGSELCRQVSGFGPAKLILVELSENNLFHIHRELRGVPGLQLEPVLADVADRPRVEATFARYAPDVVFHAAAHKHVPMMEWNPDQAIRNNVVGTRVIAETAARADVEAFVMISTDKAVRPTSVMGASKRAAELLVQALNAHSSTRFVTVRFGNVLGSRGSVVPIFKEQIAAGGPVTVTHPEMTRYFMTIPEACQLVMQAATMGEGAEIFILDMGQPVKIVDLARDLIRLSGLREDEDIKIEFIGVRPGEKLHEELSSVGELDETEHRKIKVEREPPRRLEDVDPAIGQLEGSVNDPDGVRAALRRLIPEFSGVDEASRP